MRLVTSLIELYSLNFSSRYSQFIFYSISKEGGGKDYEVTYQGVTISWYTIETQKVSTIRLTSSVESRSQKHCIDVRIVVAGSCLHVFCR